LDGATGIAPPPTPWGKGESMKTKGGRRAKNKEEKEQDKEEE
jgi:hypothetical protein